MATKILTAAEQQTKDRLWARWNALKSERSSWDSQAQQLSRFLLPRNSRYTATDRNRGDRSRFNDIYDNTGTRAVKVLAAGMMAGMTSPARPWFKLATPDKALMQYGPVKQWLADVTSLMLTVFAKSNTYRALHQGYMELGVFGTFATVVANDFEGVIHHHPQTFGQYAIATDWRGVTNTLYREFQKPVDAVVREFGYENCAPSTQRAWDARNWDQWVTIVHAIEPRPEEDRNPSLRTARHMPWRSAYFEQAGPKTSFLRDSGFRRFPALAARWDVVGSDIYGASPGMDALGDVKQLQQEQLRKAQAIDYQTRPPVQVPTASKAQAYPLPGDVSFVDAASPQGGIRTAFEVQLDLNSLLLDIQDVRERIKSAFYADLFLMLSQDDGSGRMTATEVAERHEEKLLMLGPVLERLHNEMLAPLIEITFERLLEAGLLPPPPPEMEGMDLDVEFVSMLAQAQRAVSTNSIDRFVLGLGQVAALGKGDALDKFDSDQWVDIYADALGVDPKLIVPSSQVALIRQQRAAAQQQAAQAAAQAQAADSVAKLGRVPTQGGASNAGQDIINQYSGYGSPSAENY